MQIGREQRCCLGCFRGNFCAVTVAELFSFAVSSRANSTAVFMVPSRIPVAGKGEGSFNTPGITTADLFSIAHIGVFAQGCDKSQEQNDFKNDRSGVR